MLLVAVHTWSSAVRGAVRKLQIINYLTEIRVGKTTTLKMPKSLISSRIRVALHAGCSVFLRPVDVVLKVGVTNS